MCRNTALYAAICGIVAYVLVRTYICTVRYMGYEICNTRILSWVVGREVYQGSPPTRMGYRCCAVTWAWACAWFRRVRVLYACTCVWVASTDLGLGATRCAGERLAI